jgi:lysophospholipase L1-like esterase
MRRRLAGIILLLATMAGGGVASAAERRPLKLLLIGDYPLQRLEVYANMGLLDRLLDSLSADQFQWKVAYAGVPGAVTYAFNAAPAALAGHRPDYVAVAYGQLDLVLTAARRDPAVFEQNLTQLLNLVAQHAPAAKVVLMTSIPFADGYRNGDAALDVPGGWDSALESNVNSVTRRMAQERSLPLLDLHEIIRSWGRERLLDGKGQMPNSSGRQLLAHTICEGIARLALRDLQNSAAPDAERTRRRPLNEAPEMGRRNSAGTDAKLPRFAEPPQAELTLLGDSVTALSLGLPVLTGRFEDALSRQCENQLLWNVVNMGVGGETSEAAGRRVEDVLNTCRPDYITVSYGLNDMGFTDAKKDPKVFEKNLRALVEAISAHAARPQIILLTCTPFRDDRHFWKDDPVFQAKGGLNVVLDREINAATRRLAVERKLPLLDMFRYFTAAGHETLISNDGVHPSAEGGRLMAEKLYAGLGAFARARVLKIPEAMQAEDRARALVTEGVGLVTRDRKRAGEKAEAAAEMCPYLAEAAALLAQLKQLFATEGDAR